MKYKIGDYVKIKTWEELTKIARFIERFDLLLYREDCIGFNVEMKKYCGKKFKIIRKFWLGNEEIIELDNSACKFSEWMLDNVEKNIFNLE